MSEINVHQGWNGVAQVEVSKTSGVINASGRQTDYVLRVSPADVSGYTREGNDLVLDMCDGGTIRIKNFFAHGVDFNHLVFANAAGEQAQYADFSAAGDDQGSLLPLLLVLAAGAALASSLGGGGGDNPQPVVFFTGMIVNDPDKNDKIDASGKVNNAPPGAKVTLIWPDGTSSATTVDQDGFWKTESPTTQHSGNVTAIATDGSGKPITNSDGNPITDTVDYTDVTPPKPPEVRVYDDDHDDKPWASGKAEPGSKVTVTWVDGSTSTTTVDKDGNWSVKADNTQHSGDIKVTATDQDNNVSDPATAHYTDVTSPQPPEVKVNDDDHDDKPWASGKAEPGSTVTVTWPDGATSTTTAGKNGDWSSKAPTEQDSGDVKATATDQDGNVSDPATVHYTDVTPPGTAPTITGLMDNQEYIIGPIKDGDFTNDKQPVVSGTGALANGVVNIYDGTTFLGSTMADAAGNWSVKPRNPLTDGDHTITAKNADKAGNESGDSNSWHFTLDTVAPTQSTVITTVMDNHDPQTGPVDNGGWTNDTAPQIRGTISDPLQLSQNEHVVVLRDGKVIGTAIMTNATTWTIDDSGLQDGHQYIYTAWVEDAAGNRGGVSKGYIINVDTTAPTQRVSIDAIWDDVLPGTGDIGNGNTTNDSTPELRGSITSALGDNEEVAIYRNNVKIATIDKAHMNGTSWSYTDSGLSNDTDYTYTARVVDKAGNTGNLSNAYEIHTQWVGPSTKTTITTVWDDQAPVIGDVSNGGWTNDTTPQIRGNIDKALDTGETVMVYRDGALLGQAKVTGTTWTYDDSGLQDGQKYTYMARVEDSAHNQGPDSMPWVINIDTTPPAQTVTLTGWDDKGDVTGEIHNNDTTDDDTPTFKGTISDKLAANEEVHVFRNGADIGKATVNGTDWTYEDGGLSSGQTYTYVAKVVDAAGNTGHDSNSLTFMLNTSGVDNFPKILRIEDNVEPVIGPVPDHGSTNDSTPTLIGSINSGLQTGEHVQVLRNGVVMGTATMLSATTWSYEDSGLVEGQTYVYTAQVVNAAGTHGAVSNTWTITFDTTPPDALATITNYYDHTGGKTGWFDSGTVTDETAPELRGKVFGALGVGEVIAVYRDGARLGEATVAANGVDWTFQDSGLQDGKTYTYIARAEDAAGNRGTASAAFTIPVSIGPESVPVITGATDNVEYYVGPIHIGDFTNDSQPVISGNKGTPGGRVNVYDGSTLLGSAIANSSGEWTFAPPSALVDGSHTITAKNVGATGNESDASNGWSFTVDTISPTESTTITTVMDNHAPQTGPVDNGGWTNDTAPQIQGAISDALDSTQGEHVVVLRDGKVIGTATMTSATTWTINDSGLQDGHQYIYTAWVEDAASNRGGVAKAYVINVDTSAPTQTVAINAIWDFTDPVTGDIGNGNTTNESSPELRGSISSALADNEVVAIYRNNVKIGTATVNGASWTYDDSGLDNHATYSYTARVEDAAGNAGPSSGAYTITIETTGPDTKTVITTVWDDQVPVIGDVANGGWTNDTTPQVRGTISQTLNPGETLVVLRDGAVIGTATVTGTTWTYDDSGLHDGQSYTYTARVEDAAHNPGTNSSAYTINIDITPPAQTVTLHGWDDKGDVTGEIKDGVVTDDDTPTLYGTISAPLTGTEEVHVFRDGTDIGKATMGASGTDWSLDDGGLSSGQTYTYVAKVVDKAGNTGADSNSLTFTLDTSGVTNFPTILRVEDNVEPVVGPVPDHGSTNDSHPTLIGSTNAALQDGQYVEILRDGVAMGHATMTSATTWSYVDGGLIDGQTYVYTAQVVNAAGAHGRVSNTWTITFDITPPDALATIEQYFDHTGQLTGWFDSGTTTDETAPELRGKVVGALGAGEVIAVYRDGVRLGTADVNGSDWTFQDAGLKDQTYTYVARAEDAAGNHSDPSKDFIITVDTRPSPVTVEIDKYFDNVGQFTGLFDSGTYTDDTSPELRGKVNGTLKPGDEVVIYRNGQELSGHATVDASGVNWTYQDDGLANGETYTYIAYVRNTAGNNGDPSNKFVINVDIEPPLSTATIDTYTDNEGPLTGDFGSGTTTDDTSPRLNGTIKNGPLAANEVVVVYRDGQKLDGHATLNATGDHWTYQDDGLQDDKIYTYVARVEDAAGNQGDPSADFIINVSFVPTLVPTITDVHDNHGVITGTVKDGMTTDDVRPDIKGTGALANGVVNIYDGSAFLGSATADAHGDWTYTPTKDLSESLHTITAKNVGAAGNESGPSNAWSFTVDTTPPGIDTLHDFDLFDDVPPVTGTIEKGSETDDRNPEYKGTADSDVAWVNVYDNGAYSGSAAVDSSGHWSYTPVAVLGAGPHVFTAHPVDAVGNEGGVADTWDFIVLGTPPLAPAIDEVLDTQGSIQGRLEKGDYTDDTALTVSGTGEAGVTVTLYVKDSPGGTPVAVGTAVVDGTGHWSVKMHPPMSSDGDKYITAQAQDGAGQLSDMTGDYWVILDTTAPDKPAVPDAMDNVGAKQGPIHDGDTTDDTTPVFSGTGEPNATVTIYDGGKQIDQVKADGKGAWSYTPSTRLVEGDHSITVTETDRAGNTSVTSDPLHFTVDTSGVIVSIDKVLDKQPPKVGDIANGGATDDTAPTLVGKATPGAEVIVSEEGKELGRTHADANRDWSLQLSGQSEGTHHYDATAQNAAGTTGEDHFTLIIDTTPPPVPGIDYAEDDVGMYQGKLYSGDVTDDTTPTLYGSGATPGDTINIYDNGGLLGSVEVKSDGTWVYTPDKTHTLNEGEHKLQVSASDPVGNESAKSSDFVLTVDITPPTAVATISAITDDTGVPGDFITSDTTLIVSATVTGTVAADETVQISVDNGLTWHDATLAGGVYQYDNTANELDEGTYTFKARVIDKAGNIGTITSKVVTIDTTPPDVLATITDYYDHTGDKTGWFESGTTTDETAPELRGKVIGTLETGDVVAIYRSEGGGATVRLEVKATDIHGSDWTYQDSGLQDGKTYTYVAYVEDAAWNHKDPSADFIISVDTGGTSATAEIDKYFDNVEPQTGLFDSNTYTNDTSPELRGKVNGTLKPGDEVVIYRNGQELSGHATVDASGVNWTYLDDGLANGETYTYIAYVRNTAGNNGDPSNEFIIHVDTTPPNVLATITDYYDHTGDKTGWFESGTTTDETAPELRGKVIGTLGAGEVIAVYRDGVRLGEADVSGGDWTFQDGDLKDQNTYHYRARAEDAAGNQGTQSDEFIISVDTGETSATAEIDKYFDNVEPQTGLFDSNTYTNDTSPELRGKVVGTLNPGDEVVIYRNGQELKDHATVDASGVNWTYLDDGLANGETYTYIAYVRNTAGNNGDPSNEFIIHVDTVPPDALATITDYYDHTGSVTGWFESGTTTDETAPELRGKVIGTLGAGEVIAVYRDGVRLGEADVSGGDWTYQDGGSTGLSDGKYTYYAQVEDAAGNQGKQSDEFIINVSTVDISSPTITDVHDNYGDIQGTVKDGMTTDDVRPDIKGTGALPNGRVNIYDDGTLLDHVTADGAGNWSYTPSSDLSESLHTITAKNVGDNGNESGPSNAWSFTVDVTQPTQTVTIVRITEDTGLSPNDFVTKDDDGLVIDAKLSMALNTGDTLKYSNDNGTTWTDITSFVVGRNVSYEDKSLTKTTTIKMRVDDVAGNHGKEATQLITIDTTPPGPIDGSSLDLVDNVLGKDGYTGTIIPGTVTDDYRPVFKGLAGSVSSDVAVVNVYDSFTDESGKKYDLQLIGSAVVNSDGSWSFQPIALLNGEHNYQAAPVDLAGNEGVMTSKWNFSVYSQAALSIGYQWISDSHNPVNNWIINLSYTAEDKPHIIGSAAPYSTITVTANGTVMGTAMTDPTGRWTMDIDYSNLQDGPIVLDAEGVGADGRALYGIIYNYTLTRVPPTNTSELTAISDDTGLYSNDLVTSDRNLVFQGTLSKPIVLGDNFVYISIDGDPWQQCYYDRDSGYWNFDNTANPLDNGEHTIETKVVNFVGLDSGVSKFIVTIEPLTDGPNIIQATAGTSDYHGLGKDGHGDTVNIVDFGSTSTAVTVDLTKTGEQDTGAFGKASFTGIQGLYGGSGNDTFTANGDDNIFNGRGGDDTFYLSPGSHTTLLYEVVNPNDPTGGNGADTVYGFTVLNYMTPYGAVPGGDRIDLSGLLIGYQPEDAGAAHYIPAGPLNPKAYAVINDGDNIGDYLSVTHSGGNTTINIDRDGAGSAYSSTPLVTLVGVDVDLATLLANHQIVVG